MKKLLLTSALLCFGVLLAQNNKQFTKPGFDEGQALEKALARGLSPKDYAGYVEHQRQHWLQEHGLVSPQPQTENKIKQNNTISSLPNIDFENGDYTGWQLFVGENTLNSNGPLQNIRAVANAGATDLLPLRVCNAVDSNRHGLMTNLNVIDSMSGMSLASTMGGNYVARLNRYCMSMEATVLKKTFTVNSANSYLNYVYAVVLEDGGHLQGEQTYFMVRITDQMGALIDSVYMQAANGTTPGFYPIGGAYPNTYYKPWTPVSVNLTAYIGTTVSIEVTSADCIYGGHSGYAYFDASTDSASIPNVWPGDANYDLTADLNDLFYIGWAYGAIGTTRIAATNNWQAEPSTDWGVSTAYGTEFKHADCNGDGMIDDNDTLAIMQNYGLNHPFKYANQTGINALSTYRNLQITPSISTVGPNQPLTLTVALPVSTNTMAVNDLFGISFRLYLPATYIGSLTSNDFSGSYIGTKGSTMMTLSKANVGSNYIDYSFVGKTHVNINGGGNVLAINLMSSNFSVTGVGAFGINDIRAVTQQGTHLNIGCQDVYVNFNTAAGIQNITSTQIQVVPNPASDKIIFDGLIDTKINIEVVNVIGQSVLKINLDGKKGIDVSSFERGAYFIKLYTQQGVIIKKFIKE